MPALVVLSSLLVPVIAVDGAVGGVKLLLYKAELTICRLEMNPLAYRDVVGELD